MQDEVLNVDRPRLIANDSISLLNQKVSHTVGYAEMIISVQENIDDERGLVASSKTTDVYTTKLYHTLSWKYIPYIHSINMLTQIMSSISIRNLASHVITVSYSNFMYVYDRQIATAKTSYQRC